jgi:hypothetical protein
MDRHMQAIGRFSLSREDCKACLVVGSVPAAIGAAQDMQAGEEVRIPHQGRERGGGAVSHVTLCRRRSKP